MRLIPKHKLNINRSPDEYHDPFWDYAVRCFTWCYTDVTSKVERRLEWEIRQIVKDQVLGTLFYLEDISEN